MSAPTVTSFGDLPAAVVVWQLDGTILHANAAFLGLLDLSEEEVLRHGYWALSAGGQKQRELNEILSVGRAFDKDFLGAGGRVIPVTGQVSVQGEDQGRVFVGVFLARSDDGQRSGERVLQRQNGILLALAKDTSIDDGDLPVALRALTEAASSGMGCARASVWMYDAGRTKISCEDLFERATGQHSSGIELSRAAFPGYFEALAESRQIVANDAHGHPATREFSASYLTPLGIVSMLDAPIRLHGETVGVLCHEHIGLPRAWTQEEQTFAGSVADVVSRALEARARRKAEEALSVANAELEARVLARTAELRAARDELWGEMELARRIQTVLVPATPSAPGYAMTAVTKAAAQVGGDFYDVIPSPSGDDVWVIIGDVSGHGVPAGLIMMMCQTALRAVIAGLPGTSPSNLLACVNRVLRHNVAALGEERYVTLTALRVSADGCVVHAGLHQDLMVYRPRTGAVEVLPTDGVYLGMTDDVSALLPEGRFTLGPGDVLLLYTDGITEAVRGGEMLGPDALAGVLRRHGSAGEDALRAAICDMIDTAEVSDDVTAVIVRKAG